ncbi:MAG: hypothetical protein MZU97_17225 [Bacillus subtilis]|nr:hypothetical protein [Bacillus subtilis]
MYDFKFADIGEGIHEGRILKWNYAVGDAVKEGDTLVRHRNRQGQRRDSRAGRAAPIVSPGREAGRNDPCRRDPRRRSTKRTTTNSSAPRKPLPSTKNEDAGVVGRARRQRGNHRLLHRAGPHRPPSKTKKSPPLPSPANSRPNSASTFARSKAPAKPGA